MVNLFLLSKPIHVAICYIYDTFSQLMRVEECVFMVPSPPTPPNSTEIRVPHMCGLGFAWDLSMPNNIFEQIKGRFIKSPG